MVARTFTAEILRPDDGPGHAIAVPFDPREAFGRVRAPVFVRIDEHPAFRTTLASYGGRAYIGMRNAQLADLELAAGDTVRVTVDLDENPRAVELPAELTAALDADPDLATAFARLPPSHRGRYAAWVAEAKRPETRARRAADAARRISGGPDATTGSDRSGRAAR